MMNFHTTRLRDIFAGRHEPENMKPMADALWRTLLVSACVFTVVFVCYGLWVFWGVIENLNSPYANSQPTPAPTINRIKLQEVLGEYQSRQNNFDTIRVSAPAVPDPSR